MTTHKILPVAEQQVLGRTEVRADGQPMEIEPGVIGAGLGLAPAEVPLLMKAKKITVLCERGTGDDEGCHRITFHYANRRFRILIDRGGHLFDAA